jgi:uncharacterized damage-inducible protein DinB
MAETQRRPVPRVDSGELDTALAFLNFNRESVLKKTEGLDDEQLRRRLVGTGTNLLGLIQHLARAERNWFGYYLTGAAHVRIPGSGMRVPQGRSTAEVLDEYRAAIAASDAAIRAIGDPEAPLARLVGGKHMTMRWLIAHMTSETARHAGHADILRELIDGTTGR